MENIELEEYFEDLESCAEEVRDAAEELISNIVDVKDDFFFHNKGVKIGKKGNLKVDTTAIDTSLSNLEISLQKLKDELNEIRSS
ncbi:hypothetical protein HPDP_00463 [Candidatus Hepatincola sp. Pdp]